MSQRFIAVGPLFVTLWLLLGALAPCSGGKSPARRNHQKGRVMQTALDDRTIAVLAKAELVWIGQIEKVEDSPRLWSGRILAFQSVHYLVERVLKSELFAKTPGQSAKISVRHLLVQGARTVDAAEPRLVADLFQPGQRLLLLLKSDADGLRTLDADRAVLLADAETVKAVERSLGNK